jgi:uncharacterized alpha/beta hydrolase family protein
VEDSPKPAQIEIFYEKNPLYRTIYTDGLIGGLTPANAVSLSFYATRNPIPKSTLHEVAPNKAVNPTGIPSKDSKFGIIREIEVGVYMNKETAKDIFEFLKKIFESDGK